MFNKTPICEVCGEHEATSFSYLITNLDTLTGEWKFVCLCTNESEDYYIPVEKFFANPPAVVDWMAHMQGKDWMDWDNFMKMMKRFRKATNSYNSL